MSAVNGTEALDDLRKTCETAGKSYPAAQRLVRRIVEGNATVEEAASLVALSIGGGTNRMNGANGGGAAASLTDMLKGIDARRISIGAELEQWAKRRDELKAEERSLNAAAKALRRITGAKNEAFTCDVCELPFASRQGLSTHKTRTHRARAKASR